MDKRWFHFCCRAAAPTLALLTGCAASRPTVDAAADVGILVRRGGPGDSPQFLLKRRLVLHLDETWSLVDQDGDVVPGLAVPASNLESIEIRRDGVVEGRRRGGGGVAIGVLAVYRLGPSVAHAAFRSEEKLNATVRKLRTHVEDLIVVRPARFMVRAIDREPRYQLEAAVPTG